MDNHPSHRTKDFCIRNYCDRLSVKQDPLLARIVKDTLEKVKGGGMVGAPEVHQLGQNMLRLIQGKRALDVGTFTGASAVAWALAMPPDGEVLTMDNNHEALKEISEELILSHDNLANKITFKLGPANDILDSLIAAGGSGKWDFAFIDADKPNYMNYYEKCLQLLRPGGVILIDNSLWHGAVLESEKDACATVIDKVNQFVYTDERVDNMLLNLADGVNLIFKRYPDPCKCDGI